MWAKHEWITFFAFIIISAIFIKPAPTTGWNDASRMAGIQAVVEQNTLIIDNTLFNFTGDKVFINGHFYSDKPVMSYLIAVPIYSLLYNVGISFANYPNLVYFILTLLVINVSVGIMLVYFSRFLSRYKLNTKTRIFYTLTLGFCTLLFVYTLVFNNHALTAAFLFLSFYSLLNSKKPIHFAGAGLLIGLTATFEPITGPVFLACFIGFLLYKRTAFPKIFCFITTALIPVVIYLIILISITGNIVPFQLNEKLFDYSKWPYPVSHFEGDISTIKVRGTTLADTLNYAADLILGSKGFFIFSPLLLFSLAGLIIAIKKESKYRGEAITVGIGILLAFTLYITKTLEWGGSNFGFRHTVALIPILYGYTPLVFQKYKNPLLKLLFAILLLLAIGISIMGIIKGPWACNCGILAV
ncbi:MAG: hypothetical protein QXX65_03825 [Candidatus Woesearchaeota archaeon]